MALPRITMTFPDMKTKHLFLTKLQTQLVKDKIQFDTNSIQGSFESTNSLHIESIEDPEV